MAVVAIGGCGAPSRVGELEVIQSKYADWTDILSRELKSWISDVRRDEVNIARHMRDLFDKILINPMYIDRTPLVEPMLVHGHIWEKRDLTKYVQLCEKCFPGSDVTMPEGESFLSQSHDFALDVMEWARTSHAPLDVIVYHSEESALALAEEREALGTMALLGTINERHRTFLLKAKELEALAARVMAGHTPLPAPVDYVSENTAAIGRIKETVASTVKTERATLTCMEAMALRAEAERSAKEKREAELIKELARLEAENASMR